MTGGHLDDAKPQISFVNDKKLRLVERISLLNYDDLVNLIENYYHDRCDDCTVEVEMQLCEICQIAKDFGLV